MYFNNHPQTIVASITNVFAWGVTIANINEILTAVSLTAAIVASTVVAYVNWKNRNKK